MTKFMNLIGTMTKSTSVQLTEITLLGASKPNFANSNIGNCVWCEDIGSDVVFTSTYLHRRAVHIPASRFAWIVWAAFLRLITSCFEQIPGCKSA